MLIEPVGLKPKLNLEFYTLRDEFFFLSSSSFHVNRSESISLVFLICLIISISYHTDTSYMYISFIFEIKIRTVHALCWDMNGTE